MVSLLFFGQVRDPLPTPPVIFDVLVIALFGFGGWRVWRMGREFRWLAAALWVVGLGGVYSFVFTILAGAS